MSSRRGARLVPISEDLVREVGLLAERTGKPIRVLIDEILSEALKVMSSTDVRPEEAMREYVIIHELKRLGFTLIPLRLLNSILDNSESLELWREVGLLYGDVFRVKGKELEELKRLLRIMFLDASDVALSRNGDVVELTIVSMGRSKAACHASKIMLEGFMEAQGYKLIDSKISEGIIVASFRRKHDEKENSSC
ncbi:MAG: hypothetical protein DRJ60_05125 [Thermoprotei archaeon]|nr:MAG: hypothetical protein DRJ60_05125 [Thermoprotei archaeon]